MSRFVGRNFDADILDTFIHIKKATVKINDEMETSFTKGVPDGFLSGKKSAEVEIEIDLMQFKHFRKAAKSAGSYEDLPEDDISFYAKIGDEESKVEAYGVKWSMSDILDIDDESGSQMTRKIRGIVTSPMFVHIDGVPYLSKNSTRGLLN